jgi:hypothetical protein
MDELSGTDNPFSDIYENADDIFSSHNLLSPFNRTPSPLPTISSSNTPSAYRLQDLTSLPPGTSLPSKTSLPPEGTFHSEEEVADMLHKWAMEHRFAFVKQRSRTKNKAGHKVTVWACDRYGEPSLLPKHSNQPRQRHTSSRKTGCQFSINVVQISGDNFEIRHRPDKLHHCHNHIPSCSPWSHPTHRYLNRELLDKLKELYETGKEINMLISYSEIVNLLLGMKPKDALRYIHRQSNIPFLPSDIYNVFAGFRRKRLHGLPVTDALIGYLKEKGLHYAIKPDDDNRTRYLFIVHPKSLELAYANPDIMIADCTYQTNKFNLPLLHLIGM